MALSSLPAWGMPSMWATGATVYVPPLMTSSEAKAHVSAFQYPSLVAVTTTATYFPASASVRV